METDDATLWYFAYGSNLDPQTFSGWRRMRPRESLPARLRGHRLVFDLGVGAGARGVANILQEQDDELWGVAYRITPDEASRLDLTEGVPTAYQRLDVQVEILGRGPMCAFTYVSTRRREGRMPSERYMNLLLRGARLHALPAEWIAFLRSLELATDERTTQLELFRVGRRDRERGSAADQENDT